jgi:amino acid adenylation domain-containing protein
VNARPEAPPVCVLPASFAQQRLWFLESLESAGSAYHVRLPVRLRGPLDVAALEAALTDVVQRHETLRTTFALENGEVVQVVAATLPLRPIDMDCSALDETAMRLEVARLADAPFDLARGPLFRAHLLRRSATDHVLLLVCHHLVSDAWSAGILFRDLAVLYGQRTGERLLPLRELTLQYADYAAWQRQAVEGGGLAQSLAWWRAHLFGAPLLLSLPADFARPPVRRYRGDRVNLALPADLSAALKARAITTGTTLFMWLFAACNVLLGRWAGQGEVVLGTPVAGRRRTELEPLIGLFANTLAIRTRLAPDEDFDALLERTRATLLEAFEHADLPFEKLVEALNPPRTLDTPPLVQALFTLQNTPWEATRFGAARVEPAEIGPGGGAKLDLSISAIEHADQLWLGFEYDTDLYTSDTVWRLARAFEALLGAVVADPRQRLAALPAQAAADAAAECVASRSPPVSWPEPAHADALFAARVARTPAAVALRCGRLRVSYAELDARVDALAAAIVTLQPDPAAPVAVCLPRSIDLVATLLAVWRAGRHYLPLDPAQPAARLGALLDDAGARLLIAPVAIRARLGAWHGAFLEPTTVGVPANGAQVSRCEPAPDAPAYLIYTSGSTGAPKGVVIPHGAVRNLLCSLAREPGLTAGDGLLAVTTIAFDIALLEWLLPLTVGATTVLATDDETRDVEQLLARLDDPAITLLQATPALWRNLLLAGFRGRQGLRAWCGGEPLDAALARDLLARVDDLWNLYGPTETTVWSCAARIRDPDRITIGTPIANTMCVILDDRLEPVPRGVVGELCIGGAGLALGYHAQSGRTAAAFVHTSLGRLYRTGDRARRLLDGRLQLLGRNDRQVKIRGFRVELEEVEAVLRAVTGAPAAALAVADRGQQLQLVGFVTGTHAPADIRAALRERVPEYLCPSRLIVLPELPLNANGKLDRAALLPLAGGASAPTAPAGGASAPTLTEQRLARLWSDLLGVRQVARNDDFFALGGHSLLATRLMARVRAEFGVPLRLRQIFETPTLGGLAAALDAAGGESVVPVASVPAGQSVPLSPMQLRLWFLDRLQPGNSVYHLASGFRLDGALDLPALQSAVDAVVARHEALRTIFPAADGEPVQQVLLAATLPVRVQALAGDPAAVAERLAAEPFDLGRGPLLRVAVAGNDDRRWLLIVIHHIVSDGWSLQVLYRELAEAYRAARAGELPSFVPLPLQYPAFAAAEHARRDSPAWAHELEWWQQKLADAPPFLELPADRPRPPVPSGRGARHTATADARLVDRVRALARTSGATPFMVLLTAFKLLLGRQAGTEDVVLGSPVAGRGRVELEPLIGFFVNTLILRTSLAGNPTGRELLGRVRESVLAALEHADVPFEELVTRLNPVRDPARTPLVQVLFNLHNEPVAPLTLEGLSVTPVAVGRRTAKFDLSVSVTERAGGFGFVFEYNTDLFLATTIERFAADYLKLLESFVDSPELAIAGLGCVEPATATVEMGADEELVGALRESIARHPRQLIGAEHSFATVQAEALRIAGALVRAGVRPGDRVGLWFGHATGQVSGILGVLEAGGTYVPLDPAAPPARLDAIARSAGLGALLSDLESLASGEGWLRATGLPLVIRELTTTDGIDLPPATPDTFAYLLHTSGTTGEPKGVPQTRRNVLAQVRAWTAAFKPGPDDAFSLFSTYGFDAAAQDVFAALLHGAALHPLDVRRLERTVLLDRIASRGLTVLHLTPTVYRYLFGGTLACRQDLSRVRVVILGGEPARRANLELFKARFRRGARFINGYGLSEASSILQWHADHDTQVLGPNLPIGAATGTGRVSLVDESGAPAVIKGEIVLDSEFASPGYWPLAAPPARTARRFATGDFARRLPDGALLFTGRRDARLKVAGIRIEAGDVEAALVAHDDVLEAGVVAVPDTAGDNVLVACVAPRPGRTVPDPFALRAHLRTHLPESWLPARYGIVDALPRLPNGKLDRRALDALAAPAVGGASAPILSEGGAPAPTADIEHTLLDLWSTLLGHAVGLDDDFFASGGHSLLATRLIARIRDRLGRELPLIAVFEAPTVRTLAQRLASAPAALAGPRPRAAGPV